MPCWNQSPYDLPAETSRLTSPSSTIRPRARSTRKMLPGLQAPLAQDVLGRLVEHAGLGAEHDPAVLGLQPAAGPQAVAVERRADHAAVGERDRGGAVPRLHQARMEGVEVLQVLGQIVPALVRLRDHHHHRVRDAAAREREQLEHVVERRRVRPAGPHDRQDLRQVVAEQLGCELRLARAHPVDVSAQRVDLAVVGDHPVRVRELPARERVRREARVDERERGLGPRVLQVRVVAEQLRRREHALVDDGAGAERRDHQLRPGRQLGDAADHVQLALERVRIVGERTLGRDDQVLDVGRVEVGGDADVVLVDRDVAPADDALPFVGDGLLEQLLQLGSTLGVGRQEADADAVGARGRQRGADDRAHQLVGHLEQDPGAVARVGVSARGSAMLEVGQRHDGTADGLVRRLAVQARDERDATCVVLVLRVVETDRTGRPWHPRHSQMSSRGRRRSDSAGGRKGSSGPGWCPGPRVEFVRHLQRSPAHAGLITQRCCAITADRCSQSGSKPICAAADAFDGELS